MHQFITAAQQLSGAQQSAKRTKAAITTLRNQAQTRVDSKNKALQQKQSLLATLTAQQQQTVTTMASPGGTGTPSPPTTKAPAPAPANTNAGKAVAFTYAQIGCPYVFGATGRERRALRNASASNGVLQRGQITCSRIRS